MPSPPPLLPNGMVRPTWRGRLHLYALLAALPALALLVSQAEGTRLRVGVLVYGLALCSMLAVSTTYHRWVHDPEAKARWQRADHATIYAAIAGTFTPFSLAALSTRGAVVLLVVVWALAGFGAGLKATVWQHWSRRVGAFLYLALGWGGIILAPAIWDRSGAVPVVLLLIGGMAYTLGACCLAWHWPTLRPATFSYHEVWHAFTLVAAVAHLAAVWVVVA